MIRGPKVTIYPGYLDADDIGQILIMLVAFSLDVYQLASGSSNNIIKIWDLAIGAL